MVATPDVAYFEPRQPKPEPDKLTLRWPAELREDIQEIADFWTDLNTAIGQPEKVSLNDVILRMLTVGRDGVWAEYGTRPGTKAERKELLDRVAASYLKSKT